jgi:hypothetical protein
MCLSEWLLFNANSVIVQLYNDENMLICNEMVMMMISALYYINTFSWIFIALAHCNKSPRIDISPHLDTLLWIQANQSFFFLVNDSRLVESQQIPMLLSFLSPDPGSNPRSTAFETIT